MKVKKLLKTIIVLFTILVLSSVFSFYGCLGSPEDTVEPPGEAEAGNDDGELEEELEEESEEEAEEIEEDGSQDHGEDTESEGDIVEGYVYPAILKSVNLSNGTITVEQLINEPDQAEIGSNLKLAADYNVRRIVVIRNEQEKEYSRDISLEEVATGSEIGIIFKENMVSTIISSFLLDASVSPDKEEINPSEGEYMVAAILKAVDTAGNTITVEQLINEPDEEIIEPGVKLASGYRVYKSILIRSDEGEKEYTAEISIGEIPLNTEIGIGFGKDNLAKIIISQEWFED
jgi:hypothetical protein